MLEALLALDSVTVQARTAPAQDAEGGLAKGGWGAAYADVPARVEDASASLRDLYAAQGMLVSHSVYLQQAGVGPQHRLLTSDGRYLRVQGVVTFRAIGGMPGHFRIDCEEYRPGA